MGSGASTGGKATYTKVEDIAEQAAKAQEANFGGAEPSETPEVNVLVVHGDEAQESSEAPTPMVNPEEEDGGEETTAAPSSPSPDVCFFARAENVIDQESLNGPADRGAVPMLVALDQEGKCDHWLWRPLHYAALHGLVGAVERLVRHGAVVDARTGGQAPPGAPLSRSSFNFAAEIVCPLDGKPDSVSIEEVDGDEATVAQPYTRTRVRVPLGDCVCTGHADVQHSAHTRLLSHATPLHVAIEYRHVDAVKALLERRADPNTKWNDGRDVPLHRAISNGEVSMIAALLRHKADPNVQNCWGHPPLTTAALVPQQPSAEVAKMLLEAGAKRVKPDKAGKTASQVARELGHCDFADAVEAYEVKPKVQEHRAVTQEPPLPPEDAPPTLRPEEESGWRAAVPQAPEPHVPAVVTEVIAPGMDRILE